MKKSKTRKTAKNSQLLPKFSARALERDIVREAKVLHIQSGAAKLVAKRVSLEVADWAKDRDEITMHEYNQRVAEALSLYDGNLAFVYRNRDKII